MKAEKNVAFKGRFQVEHWHEGVKIADYEFPNGVVNVGLNKILGVMFNADTPITTWYIGLIDNSPAPTLAAGDTMSSHAGWNEYLNYSEANRVTWVEGAPASQQITNGTPASFNINGAGGTVYGIFMTSDNTKSGTAGTLWSTAAFAAPVVVISGDELKVTYTLTAADA